MIVIQLTPAQADVVRGETSPGHWLMPVPLDDGTFMLPLRVLSDPAHAAVRDQLAALPQVDYTPPPETDE